jgi:hypothetical protein
VTHSEDDTSILDCLLHVKAVLKAGSHGFLAKYMVSLGSERQYHFAMHVILHRNDDRVCKALPDSLDCLSGCFQKLLPGIKHEGSVELMIAGKDIAGFCPRFCDSDDLALIWVIKGICGIVLCTMSVDW